MQISDKWKALAGALGGLAVSVITYFTGGGTIEAVTMNLQSVGGIVVNMAVGAIIVYLAPANETKPAAKKR